MSNPVLEYTTVSGDDYLVEVKNKDVSRVPKDWIKMSGTKSVARFRSPFIVEQVRLVGRRTGLPLEEKPFLTLKYMRLP